ncbi:unnamed protein product [Prunus brigantina]
MRRRIRSRKGLNLRPEPLLSKSLVLFARCNLQIQSSLVITMLPNIPEKSLQLNQNDPYPMWNTLEVSSGRQNDTNRNQKFCAVAPAYNEKELEGSDMLRLRAQYYGRTRSWKPLRTSNSLV